MDDLIEALKIFRKYTDAHNPINCEHDVMCVNVEFNKVSKEDKEKLDKLGFFEDSENETFMSYRFGSC